MGGDARGGWGRLDYIFDHVRENYEDANLGAAATSMLGFIVVHELGHALVDLLDLPITGREEDVVDQLAAVILEAEPEIVILAAMFWRGQFRECRGVEDYADEICTYTARYDDALRLSIRGAVRCGTMVGTFSATR